MVLDSKNTYKNLKKKGFIDGPGDHKFLDFFYNDKLVLSTKISHGSSHDLDEYLVKKMAIQCKLSKNEFIDLAKCPLSARDYLDKLKEIGGILE